MNKRIFGVTLLALVMSGHQGYGSVWSDLGHDIGHDIAHPFKEMGDKIKDGVKDVVDQAIGGFKDFGKDVKNITDKFTGDIDHAVHKATGDIARIAKKAGRDIKKGVIKAPGFLLHAGEEVIDDTDKLAAGLRVFLINDLHLPPQLVDLTMVGMYKNMVDTLHDAIHSGSLKSFLEKRGKAMQNQINEMEFKNVQVQPQKGESEEEMASQMAKELLTPSATLVNALYCSSNPQLRAGVRQLVDPILKRNGGQDVQKAFYSLINQTLHDSSSDVSKTIEAFFTGAARGSSHMNLAVMIYILKDVMKANGPLCTFAAAHASKS